MCGQIEKEESELSRSKSLCDRQNRDFERQRDELLRSHATQLGELKLAAELEQARLMDEFHAQMELHRAEKEKELSALRQTLLDDAADLERRAKERTDNDAKVQYYQLHLAAGLLVQRTAVLKVRYSRGLILRCSTRISWASWHTILCMAGHLAISPNYLTPASEVTSFHLCSIN